MSFNTVIRNRLEKIYYQKTIPTDILQKSG